MAQTKVKLISDGVIDVGHLASGHGITTDNIGEGSNLYYTDARVSTYLSTNSYATEGYVTTAVANLVDSAPTTLDTLNELAAALGDDPNFATTVTNSIATKLPLAGGTLTGDIQLPAGGKIKFNDQRYFTPENNIDGAEISANGIFKVKTGVTPEERFRIDASGNIGIGVIPSSYKGVASTKVLAIGDAGNNGINVVSGNTSTGSYMFSDSGGNDRGGLIYYHTADLLDIYTAGAQRIRIDSSGNTHIKATKAYGSQTAALRVQMIPTGTNYADGAFQNIVFGNETITNGYLGQLAVVQENASASTATSMRFYTNNGGGNAATLERMRITSSGSVSIGTIGNHFGEKLRVQGWISTGSDGIVGLFGENGVDVVAGAYSNHNYILRTNNTERVRITTDGKLLINRTSGDKLLMAKTGSTTSGVHYVAGFGGNNYTTGYAVGIGLDPEGYDGRHKIGIAAEGNSTGWSTGKMHFLVKGGVGDSTEATLAESRMTIDNVGRVSIGTTSTDAKFHVEQGAVKHGSSHNSTFAAVKRFYQAQSAFNNPDIEIISSASATSSYPQISVHIKMHGRGLSANRAQYTEAIATITVNGSTLENLTQTTISHTGLGSTPAAGTFSVSGGSLYFTPNRQTNYDGYTLEARINSTHCTYNY